MTENKENNHAVKPAGDNLAPRRLIAFRGLYFGVCVIAIALLYSIFNGPILNSYGKGKIERAFAEAYPGCALRIGGLGYAIGANRLNARSVTLSTTNWTLNAGRISLSGVHWARLLRGKASLTDIFAKASIDAAGLDMKFNQAHYGIRCARLRASAPGSELTAEGIDLSPLIKDEEIFKASAFRKTRYHVFVPACKISGLAFSELLEGKSYRASSAEFSSPSFDALVNRDKPVGPFVKRPLMAHEALFSIRKLVQVDSLVITNGRLSYAERVVAGAAPGVVTFTAVDMRAEGITNRGKGSVAILLRMQGNLMNAGLLKVLMTIPVNSRDFSLHYSGTLGAMDLTRLDAFLDIAEHIRIKSGSVKELTYKVDVASGRARGHVRAVYKDFKVAILDRQNGTEYGLVNQFATFMANSFKLRSSNARDAAGELREGEVNYIRKPGDEFMQFVWFAVRSGVLNAINN